jgi:tripartite ATP-independent transporter DctP family solute receptor
MQMKTKHKGTASAVALAVILGLAAGPVYAAKVKLRIGHGTPITAIAGQGSTKMKEVAAELSNGDIEITIFPGSQLGGELEMVSQVRLGALDICMVGSGLAAAIEPTFSITELPFIWKDGESAWRVLNGPIGERLFALMEPKGMKALAWGVWGFRGFISNGFSINGPEDMKGHKIRIVENPLYVRTIKAFGGNPVPMAWPEVYSGLQQRTIEAVETNYHGMGDQGSRLYEVATDLVVTNHIYTSTVYLMNLPRFKSLSKAHQEILIKAARAGGEVMRAGAAKSNGAAIARMAKAGLKISRPDPAPFREMVQPVHDYFAAFVGHDLLAEVKAAQK